MNFPVLTSLTFPPFPGVDDELLLGLVRDEGRDGATQEQHHREGDPEEVGLRLVVDVDGCDEGVKIKLLLGKLVFFLAFWNDTNAIDCNFPDPLSLLDRDVISGRAIMTFHIIVKQFRTLKTNSQPIKKAISFLIDMT